MTTLGNISEKSTNVDHEAKSLGVWTDIADVLGEEYSSDQVRACVSAIASALREAEAGEREACAKIAKEFADEFDPESAEACVAMEINTEIEARKQLTCDHEWIDARR